MYDALEYIKNNTNKTKSKKLSMAVFRRLIKKAKASGKPPESLEF